MSKIYTVVNMKRNIPMKLNYIMNRVKTLVNIIYFHNHCKQ